MKQQNDEPKPRKETLKILTHKEWAEFVRGKKQGKQEGIKQGRLSALKDVDEMLCGFNFHQFACFNDCNYDEQEPSINYEDLIKELKQQIAKLEKK